MTWQWLRMLVKVRYLDVLNRLSTSHQLSTLKTSDCKVPHTCLKIALIPFKPFMSYVGLIAIVISLNRLKKYITALLVNTETVNDKDAQVFSLCIF